MPKSQLPVGDVNVILSKGIFKGKFNSIQMSQYLLLPLKP